MLVYVYFKLVHMECRPYNLTQVDDLSPQLSEQENIL